MKRREFLISASWGLAAAWAGAKELSTALAEPSLPRKFSATDTVVLGKTGIRTSRLAMGTGTIGFGHHSNQSALGVQGLSRLLLNGYDRGLRFFDTADAYGTHPHVAEALKHVPRDNVTVLTKSWSREPAAIRADLDRFRRELGTDHIDIFLMHCLSDATGPPATAASWTCFRKRRRRESFAPTAAPATPSARCGRQRSRPGWTWTWCASIPSARTWMPSPKLFSASCAP